MLKTLLFILRLHSYSLNHFITHSLSHSNSHSLNYLLTHSLTHLLTPPPLPQIKWNTPKNGSIVIILSIKKLDWYDMIAWFQARTRWMVWIFLILNVSLMWNWNKIEPKNRRVFVNEKSYPSQPNTTFETGGFDQYVVINGILH